jgi:hypothetical protein
MDRSPKRAIGLSFVESRLDLSFCKYVGRGKTRANFRRSLFGGVRRQIDDDDRCPTLDKRSGSGETEP